MSEQRLPLPGGRSGELSVELACIGLQAALTHARENQLQVSIAVVDRGGHLLAMARVDGTPWHSIDLAIDKACTSASFGLPSSALGEMIDNASERVRLNLTLRPDIVAMGGAVPIMLGDQLVGALGVSGASEQEDHQCSLTGCEAIVLAAESLHSVKE